MEIVSINSRKKENLIQEEQRKAMLDVLEHIRLGVESGEIKEFVACSLDSEGIAQIHVAAMDVPGSIGLFEIGKHILISQEA